jgi:hypothetical protein
VRRILRGREVPYPLAGKLESRFQRELIEEICGMFEGAIVMKLDSSYRQGVPDLLVLFHDKWATLECKKNAGAHHQPNQDWYVDQMDRMSFSRFVFPENKEEVLRELRAFFDK